METNEVREALAAVEDVERRTAEAAPQSSIPGESIALSGAMVGLAIFFAVQGFPIATFITCFVLMGVALWLDTRRRQKVRPAMKQDIEASEGTWSWKTFAGSIAAYSVMFIALQVLPRGEFGVSAAAGVVSAALSIIALSQGQKRGWFR